MRRIAPLIMLLIASLACNLERVLAPNLPTDMPEVNQATSSPTPEAASGDNNQELPSDSADPLARADQTFLYGDWDGASNAYRTVFEQSADPAIQADALLGIARVNIQLEEWAIARDLIALLQNDFADQPAAAQGDYHLAQIFIALEDYASAEAAYKAYLDQTDSSITSLVNEWRGDLFFLNADYGSALGAYQEALSFSRLGNFESVQRKIGDAYASMGDYQSAILAYQDLYINTQNDYLKSQMDYVMGQSYLVLGQEDQAYSLYLDAVENYPLAYSSYLALVDLVNAGIEVSDLDRGLIDYFAATGLEASGDSGGAAELYSLAIGAFDRYLLANPEEHLATVHHYRAQALRALGEHSAAISEWLEIINKHPFDELYQEAFAQKARTEWAYLGDYDSAVATLLGFVTSNPGLGRAPELLFTAGEIAKLNFDLEAAAQIWDRLAFDYPNSDFVYPALFNAGIAYYRLELVDQAEAFFLRGLESVIKLEDKSQVLYWLAKLEAEQGNQDEATSYWQQAAAADPSGYYSERAQDILAGIAPFTHAAPTSLIYDLESERQAAESWMVQQFSLDPNTNFYSLGELPQDPRFLRGSELWELGEYELARAQFESLRSSYLDDPLASYRLANYFIDMGLYRSGVFAARQVLTIAGMTDAETLVAAPSYFNRLRFGTYFAEIVLDEAAIDNLDPLFLFSVIRQESLFEGFVTSSAGARGLMQIIPVTGQEIADLSGWPPDYSAKDLYRPVVSIAFGTDYLERQKNNFDGDLYAALTAYNAGPGNASYWSSFSNGDMDLLLEIIEFDETQDYIKSIYELFSIYSDLYTGE